MIELKLARIRIALPAIAVLGGMSLTLGLACSASDDGASDKPRGTSGSAGAGTPMGGSTSTAGGGTGGAGQATGGQATAGGGQTSGGAAGSGGSTAGTGGAGGGSTSGGGCKDADILCLTFEEVAAGALPTGGSFVPYNCAGQSTSTDLLVEEGKGVGGSKVLTSKKTLNGGCNLLADLGVHPELWVTADVKFSTGVPVATVHELTPFEITQRATDGGYPDDPGIRPGIRADNSCNSWPGAELNITGSGERTGCTAFKFSTDEWYCLEVQVKNLATSVEADLHINTAKQPFHIHQDEVMTVVNTGWTGANTLRLGARSYSSSVDSPVYVDNLSVSTKRVGCTPK